MTREEDRNQDPVFLLKDGFPVFEVWRYHEELARWFVMAKAYDPAMVAAGVVYYSTLDELRAAIRALGGTPRA